MNWDYEYLSIQQFLDLAYQRARKIDELRIRRPFASDEH